jgi:hypothetical protein
VVDSGEQCDDGNNVDFDGCDNNCQKSACLLPELLPGAGYCHSLLHACVAEVCSAGPVTQVFGPHTNKAGLPNGTLLCTDDDPACDFGPPLDKTCTFRIKLCYNVNDPRFECIQSDKVDRVILMRPNMNKPPTLIDAQNVEAVLQALEGIGAKVTGACINPAKRGRECRLSSECDSAPGSGDGRCRRNSPKFTPPLDTADTCTQYLEIKVPLRSSSSGDRPNTTLVKLRSYAPIGSAFHFDDDSLKFVCFPK